MEEFERQWSIHGRAVERYVRFRIDEPHDAEDVLQEVMAAAYTNQAALQDERLFKPWLIRIARNKCADWLRKKYRRTELPLETLEHVGMLPRRFASLADDQVLETLHRLSPQDQLVLRLCYWLDLPLNEIARRLGIPVGTVKSRLHHARERFRCAYPNKPKGIKAMKPIMPERIPDYTITPNPLPPFECKWEEMMGWFIVPKLGEKLSWAMYDQPDGHRTEYDDLEVVGKAMVHDVEGVEIAVSTHAPMEFNAVDDSGYVQRSFVAQLTDTHCRTLSETHTENGRKYLYTFLDDYFLSNWGFGEDNCGNETNLRRKGDIHRDGSVIRTADKEFLLDVVGRYTVTIGGKSYDTICVMDVETYDDNASEQYIDKNGRTILWRRFNPDDWRLEHCGGRRWSEMLPDSERLTINGRTFVHWYDCITSYIL
ncbi:MAG: RNA polymerase sigma factor [Clostridia bacterium]|nr:RNA polymerase sigma factor [Clostridia bacterium]